jgi:hypothetical protein
MVHRDPNSGAVPQPGGYAYRPFSEDEEPQTPAEVNEEDAQAAIAGEAPFDNALAGTDPDAAADGADGDGDEDAASTPAKSASKGDWVDFAVSQGADREEADAKTKDELIAEYGGE